MVLFPFRLHFLGCLCQPFSAQDSFSGCEGPMSFYALMVLKYLNLIFKYCLYKNIDEAELASRAYTSYILRSSFDSPEELLKQLSQLQIISRSIKNLDNCEDIPNHVKDAARQKYKSLITQIKDSSNFDVVVDKLLGFDLKL